MGRLGQAEAFTLLGQLREAIALYEKLLAEYPRDLVVLNNLAHLLSVEGANLEHALQLAQQAATLAPRNAGARDTLGWVQYRLGQNEVAVQQLLEANRLAPETAIVEYHLGKALLAAGQREEARLMLGNAVKRGLPAAEQADAQKALAAL
jgi:tetratricopeptide (TPR) repeat protein